MNLYRMQNLLIVLCTTLVILCAPLAHYVAQAQDAQEALGPKDAPANAEWAKREHPLIGLMSSAHSQLRRELRGVHPRVYVTSQKLEDLKARSRTTHRDLWRRALENVRALRREPPLAPAQERRVQNEVGIGIAEAALAFKIEGDQRYLAAAKKYMDAAVSYDIWGYAYNKPNVDLAAGHLLYGMGWGYDLLYHDLSEAERTKYRDKITKQARLLFDHYKPKPGRTYSYSQNHVFIPMSGLGVAAYSLYDEVSDAPEWAALARAIFDRVVKTYSKDGYYYESFEYWVFSTPWIIHYLDAHLHATGEDLYDQPGFRQMHKYVAHGMLPSGQNVFDFGDIFEGPLTRAKKGEDYPRTHPSGRFHTNYNILYRIAGRFQNPEAQGVASWLEGFNQWNMEDYWSLLWYDAAVPVLSVERQQLWHYFEDHEVVFWRTDWTKDATAFAFKAGPPEGHATTKLLREFPDWHLSSGHAHPDANSFIIYARREYLTGDSGYAGVPMTAHHNTVLVDGRGQAREGKGHDAFRGVPYERLDRIRISEVHLTPRFAYVVGEAAAAYEPELGVERFTRHFVFTAPDGFLIWDDLRASKPTVFTSLIHADARVQQIEAKKFAIDTSNARLVVTIAEPDQVRTTVEPNDVTAAGRPGSVDKGERQIRGERLAISTPQPTKQARFVHLLRIEGSANSTTEANK